MFQTLIASPDARPRIHPANIPAPYLLTTAVMHGPRTGDADAHLHPEGMLMWPATGSAVAMVDGAMRTLAVGEGLWVPPMTVHTMVVDGASTACCTYFTRDAAPSWREVGTVQLGAALRELLLHLAASPMGEGQRLRAQRVVIELLPETMGWVGVVPIPSDGRLEPLVRRIMGNPADDRSIEDWAWQLSLSVRTISRIFATEVGMTFSMWRRMVRMAAAVRMLAGGAPVASVAHRVGYSTTSAFSAAFRQVMGSQPSGWRP